MAVEGTDLRGVPRALFAFGWENPRVFWLLVGVEPGGDVSEG